MRRNTVDECEINCAISDFFDGTGIAHSKADSPLFKAMVKKIQNAPTDYKAPGYKTLGGNLLDAQCKVNTALN